MWKMGWWGREVEIEFGWTVQLLIWEENGGIKFLLNNKSFAEGKGG